MTARNTSLATASTGAGHQSQTNPPRRILVVDDDTYIRELNAQVLSRSGYYVDAAEDGADAWAALQIEHYDLLVTDNNMPNVTGVELLMKVRAASMELPAIMVSGNLPTEEMKRHPWLQFEASLLKPYTVEALLGTVQEVLRATDGAREQIALPSNRQRQPVASGLRF